jgi:hypothetical protein
MIPIIIISCYHVNVEINNGHNGPEIARLYIGPVLALALRKKQ